MRRLGWLAGCVVFGLVVASCSVTTGESTTTAPLAEPRVAGSAPSTTTSVAASSLADAPRPTPTRVGWSGSTVPVTVAADCEGPDPSGSEVGERPRPGPEGWGTSMAFDVESGVVVATVWSLSANRSETWIFDVCTNAWRRGADVPFKVRRLVYHPGEDLTLALGMYWQGEPRTWAYDADTDVWTEMTPFPTDIDRLVLAAADPVSGLVWAGDMGHLLTFDLTSEVWIPVSLEGEPSATETNRGFGAVELMAYDPAVSGFVLVTGSRVGRTSLLDQSGRVIEVDTPTPLPRFVWGDIVSGNEMTFDAATGRVAIFSDGTLIEYDALAEEWIVLTYSDTYQDGWVVGPLARVGGSIVYDPVNQRIVLFGGGSSRMPDGWHDRDDVWAYDPISREWMVLLEAA